MNTFVHALVVPCLVHFRGLAELFASVDVPVRPFVIPNWDPDKRVSVAAAWNGGIRAAREAKCNVVHIVNDDVVLRPGCLVAMARALLRDPYAYLVSGWDEERDKDLDPALSHRAMYPCFTVEADFLDKTDGGFDEGFEPAYFEDDDMRYRLGLELDKPFRAGRRDFRVPAARYYHANSMTRTLMPNAVSHDQFASNRARYIMKWGGPPGEERFKTPFSFGG